MTTDKEMGMDEFKHFLLTGKKAVTFSTEEKAEMLTERLRRLLVRSNFRLGDLLRFKPGLDVPDVDICVYIGPSKAAPNAAEVGIIDSDGNFQIVNTDIRRLEPWSD